MSFLDPLEGTETMISNILLPIGLGLLLLTIALLILVRNEHTYQRRRLIDERRRVLGLPSGDLVYEDADGQGEILYSDQVPLVGKPDYIIKLPNGQLVPIELKLSVQNATAPHSNHVIQLAAYCLILEDYSEAPPTYGILRYADCDFTVEYTATLRKKVMRLLSEMEGCDEKQRPQLARQKVTKCRTCTFQPICPVGQGK
jgi:CRISPR-associated exonuclease Cas4